VLIGSAGQCQVEGGLMEGFREEELVKGWGRIGIDGSQEVE
jgi:hypothetical protein